MCFNPQHAKDNIKHASNIGHGEGSVDRTWCSTLRLLTSHAFKVGNEIPSTQNPNSFGGNRTRAFSTLITMSVGPLNIESPGRGCRGSIYYTCISTRLGCGSFSWIRRESRSGHDSHSLLCLTVCLPRLWLVACRRQAERDANSLRRKTKALKRWRY